MSFRLEEEGVHSLPSMLSAQDKFGLVGEQVKQIQAEIYRLEVVQRMNDHREDDLVPGSDQTYRMQYNTYNSALKRIEVCYPEFTDTILGAQRGV